MNEQTKTITWKMIGKILGIYLGGMIAIFIIMSLVVVLQGRATWEKQLGLAMSLQIWGPILMGLASILILFVLAKSILAWKWFIKNFPTMILILSVLIIVSAIRGSEPFGAFISGFFWNVSLLGVGIAVFAIAISLFRIMAISNATPTNELIRLEAALNATKEKLDQLEKLESEIRDRIAALKSKVDKLYNLTDR